MFNWVTGHQEYSLRPQNCLVINFGFIETPGFSVPKIFMSPNSDASLNFNKEEIPTSCFIVFISGKFLKEIDNIVGRLDNISEKIKMKPNLVFINSEKFQQPSRARNFYPLVMYWYSY